MTDHDLGAFADLFDDLALIGLSFTPTRDKREHAKAVYFEALRAYPFVSVRAAYQHLRETASKWPAIAQWIGAIPRNPTAGLPELVPSQMRELEEAERKGYEGDLCACGDCTAAGASHLPLRYVPVLDPQGQPVRWKHPARMQPVIMGEWLHGRRLKAWYIARAHFYELKARVEAAETAAKRRPTTAEQRIKKLAQVAEMAVAETKA